MSKFITTVQIFFIYAVKAATTPEVATVDKVNVDEQAKDDSISEYESVSSGHEEIEQDDEQDDLGTQREDDQSKEGMQIIYYYLILYYKLLHFFD